MDPIEHLARTAITTQHHLKELHAAKYTRPTPPETRTMKPTPGPREPGNAHLINLHIHIDTTLHTTLAPTATTIHTPTPPRRAMTCCDWIYHHAPAIVAAGEHTRIIAVLHRIQDTISRALGLPITEEANTTEPYRRSFMIRQLLYKHQVTDDPLVPTDGTLRLWAHRGYITSTLVHGRACYRLLEVADHITQTTPKKG